MRGALSPNSINNIKFNDKGTNPYTNAKLYYTTTPTFTTANLLGTLTSSSGGILDFNITPQTVGHGKHYF